VLGNIPYNITSSILGRLCEAAPLVRVAYLTVQKEVAQRLCAGPGSKAYGALTCFVQYHFAVRRLFDIRPGSFRPRPKVTSTFIRLTPLRPSPSGTRSQRFLFRIIRAGFGQRRKRLAAALKTVLPAAVLRMPAAAPYLTRRAEDMSLEDFAALCHLAQAASSQIWQKVTRSKTAKNLAESDQVQNCQKFGRK